MKQQLIPKPRRRKRQPSAAVMREQLRLAADEIIRLRTERDWANRHMVRGVWSVPLPWHRDPDQSQYGRITYIEEPKPRPWWRRIFRSKAA